MKKNMIGVTVAYILMVGLYAVCKIEDIFALAANMQLMVFLKEVLLVYLILALIYTGIGIIYYAWQYQSSHKQLKKYCIAYCAILTSAVREEQPITGGIRDDGDFCDEGQNQSLCERIQRHGS